MNDGRQHCDVHVAYRPVRTLTYAMNTTTRPRSLARRLLVVAAYMVAVAVGLKFGYDFGAQISGKLLGIVLALNGAVFCSFVVSMVIDRVAGPKPSKPGEP